MGLPVFGVPPPAVVDALLARPQRSPGTTTSRLSRPPTQIDSSDPTGPARRRETAGHQRWRASGWPVGCSRSGR